ncbi:hypothetical protein GCM10023115_41290 [Pontixanthobacter gangjinensis]|uniref:DUF4064 domain-containing protein n=1 Tax=Christiangramia aestuarii TaxID=1028746 RepID=A0A7K1LRQ4_9FLAO|nr:hypothetical protein [Christiangramia aestuarii]MUP43486.1 hypothetical protein [Christiangramia aestuarii]
MNSTEDHNLGIFRILYIIKGVITLAFSILPIIYIFLGVFISQKEDFNGNGSHVAGIFIILIGIMVFLFLLALGILTLLTAKYLGEKKNYDFVFVMAILNCLTGILGIILGIFTIIELNKPEVKRLFGKPA